MKLIWSGDGADPCDGSKPPQDRDIRRNCGQLLGRLDGLLPFLYLAEYGAAAWELRQQRSDAAAGLFAVAERDNDPGHPGVSPRVGLILPIKVCRDAATRAALLDLPDLVARDPHTTMSDRRLAVQARLDQTFGGDLVVAEKESLDGFFALAPTAALFRRLHAAFDYVTEVVDNPAGTVRVTATARFRWQSYGDLIEWHYRLQSRNQFRSWATLTPMLVCGNTAALPHYSTQRWAESGLRRPMEDPSRWFVIRPGLPNAKLGMRLEMRQYGWARLHVSLDEREAEIELSQVFDPFGELVAWSREIAEGDLPIEMEVDEEGCEAVLTVLCTDDPARVLLRVTSKHESEIRIEGIVARADLACAMRSELRRFFTTEFDPQHWDEGNDSLEDGDTPLRRQVLANPWLADTD